MHVTRCRNSSDTAEVTMGWVCSQNRFYVTGKCAIQASNLLSLKQSNGGYDGLGM
jgi:hypothetical protein